MKTLYTRKRSCFALILDHFGQAKVETHFPCNSKHWLLLCLPAPSSLYFPSQRTPDTRWARPRSVFVHHRQEGASSHLEANSFLHLGASRITLLFPLFSLLSLLFLLLASHLSVWGFQGIPQHKYYHHTRLGARTESRFPTRQEVSSLSCCHFPEPGLARSCFRSQQRQVATEASRLAWGLTSAPSVGSQSPPEGPASLLQWKYDGFSHPAVLTTELVCECSQLFFCKYFQSNYLNQNKPNLWQGGGGT